MPGILNFKFYGGDKDAPVLLLIHPLGADLEFWDECVSLWVPHVSCIACDLRSAGASPRAAAPVRIEDHVVDLEVLRRELSIQTLVPVGCAIGAMVAASYAARHPGRASALVLSNPTVCTSPQAKVNLSERSESVKRYGMKAILPGAVDRAFMEQPRDDKYERYFKRFASQDPHAYSLSALGMLDADISADLVKLRCPTLVVAGGNDVLLPPEEARSVQGLVSGAQYVLLAEAAHFPPFQRPQAFSALVLDFLSGVGNVEKSPSFPGAQ